LCCVVSQLSRLIASVISVATWLKLALLYRHAGFKAALLLRPLRVLPALLLACCLEHAVFAGTILYFLSDSFPHLHSKEGLDKNVRLYHALAFPELGKVFVSFLQVWELDSGQLLSMPLIFGALMLSVQLTSLQCVAAGDAALAAAAAVDEAGGGRGLPRPWGGGHYGRVYRPLLLAVALRTLTRLCFHSLYHTLALGIIL
jgi:hypothetical protein